MVEMALLGEEGLYASPLEVTPGNPAYTVDTLAHFARAEPDSSPLIIGGDSFADLPHWRRWREVVEAAAGGAAARPGWEPEALLAGAPGEARGRAAAGRARQSAGGRLVHRAAACFAAGGSPPGGSVPEPVVKYIAKYGLYR
jgi:nicotinic acid mononucleotide adenylyltransferase